MMVFLPIESCQTFIRESFFVDEYSTVGLFCPLEHLNSASPYGVWQSHFASRRGWRADLYGAYVFHLTPQIKFEFLK
jgi:hypothetical protein